jgi:hypothetical protein
MKENLYISKEEIHRAVDEGVLKLSDAERLIHWKIAADAVNSGISNEPSHQPETAKGFNLVTVAYYFGAMLMISACAWFLGDKWDSLGSPGVLATGLIYLAIAVSIGYWLRTKGYLVGGGLLITVGICLVPLITYSIEDILGWWPAEHPGEYKEYYPWINGSWIVMELGTIVAGLVTLRYVRFGFLTAPLAFSFWFLSMDIAALILGTDTLYWNARSWISVVVGAVTIILGYFLEKTISQNDSGRSEDFAFWCYLFGLMAFWGGLTSLDSDSEFGKALYALVNIGLMGIGLKLKRTVFLVFGAIGIHFYLGHLAYAVFKDSFLFPFVLAFIGLSLILITVFSQRYLHGLSKQ